MGNNPTLTFNANEPLSNTVYDRLENATDFTRVFVGRMANSSRYMIALDDNRLGYGVYQYYAYDRMYLKQDRNVNGNYFGTVASKGISDGHRFYLTQILDTDESNYTNSDKTYVVIDGTRYNYSSNFNKLA